MKINKNHKKQFIKMVFDDRKEALRSSSDVVTMLPNIIYHTVTKGISAQLYELPEGWLPEINTIGPRNFNFFDLEEADKALSKATSYLLRMWSVIDMNAFDRFEVSFVSNLDYVGIYAKTGRTPRTFRVPFSIYTARKSAFIMNIGDTTPLLNARDEIISAAHKIKSFKRALNEIADAISKVRTTNGLRSVVPELSHIVQMLEKEIEASKTHLPAKTVSCESLNAIGIECKR